MTPAIQQELLRRLAEVCELSPEVRFGQLLAHLGFLVEDRTDYNLGDVSDYELLGVIEAHRVELQDRQQQVA